MKILIFIQARMGSSRLPGKVLMSLGDRSLLGFMLDRAPESVRESLVLLTSDQPADDALATFARGEGIGVFRGSESDVLDRFARAAEEWLADGIVRLTADCPLLDWMVVDALSQRAVQEPDLDLISVPEAPNGLLSAEYISTRALRVMRETTSPTDTYHREHVMTYIEDFPYKFRVGALSVDPRLREPTWRLCVDTVEDLEVVRTVVDAFAPRTNFSAREIVDWLRDRPNVRAVNRDIRQKGREDS